MFFKCKGKSTCCINVVINSLSGKRLENKTHDEFLVTDAKLNQLCK